MGKLGVKPSRPINPLITASNSDAPSFQHALVTVALLPECHHPGLIKRRVNGGFPIDGQIKLALSLMETVEIVFDCAHYKRPLRQLPKLLSRKSSGCLPLALEKCRFTNKPSLSNFSR